MPDFIFYLWNQMLSLKSINATDNNLISFFYTSTHSNNIRSPFLSPVVLLIKFDTYIILYKRVLDLATNV